MSIIREINSSRDPPVSMSFARKQWPHPIAEYAHADRANPDSPLKIIAYCTASPAPDTIVGRLRVCLVGSPIYFTKFKYDENGHSQTCTRDELRSALVTMVGDWNELIARGTAVMGIISGLRMANGSMTIEERVDYEARFWTRLVDLRNRTQDTVRRLRWAATRLGKYLHYLSQYEDWGLHPNLWATHPHQVTAQSVRFPEQPQDFVWPRKGSDPIDDWAFRAAKAVNSSEPPAEVQALHQELEDMAAEILAYKGYKARALRKFLPKLKNGPVPKKDPAPKDKQDVVDYTCRLLDEFEEMLPPYEP